MKAILILIVVVVLMVLAGWLTYTTVNGDPQVTINTEAVQKDVDQAAEAGREAADAAAEKAGRLADEVRRTDVDVDIRRDESP